MSTVVVVGAGVGGLRTAEALRRHGHAGPITIVGDEPLRPYDRPPLSKEALHRGLPPEALPVEANGLDWRLGQAVRSCDLEAGSLLLDDGEALRFDGLAIATGLRPRPVLVPGPLVGRHRLRTAADAVALRDALRPGARLAIVGAGFIGCEVAASARALGCEVDVIASDPVPLQRPLGEELGRGMQRRHEAHGVRFHLGRTPTAYRGVDRVRGVHLDDGQVLEADLVLEAIGSVPNVEWLEGNGLDLVDGVLADGHLVVEAPRPVVAVGDVARFPDARLDPVPRRIEHWTMPAATARVAGPSLVALLRGEEPGGPAIDALPSFWSDQYDHQVQSLGWPGQATRVEVVDGTPEGPCIAEYRDGGRLVGVVGIDRTPDVARYRRLVPSA